jgi:hypothetical protein
LAHDEAEAGHDIAWTVSLMHDLSSEGIHRSGRSCFQILYGEGISTAVTKSL